MKNKIKQIIIPSLVSINVVVWYSIYIESFAAWLLIIIIFYIFYKEYPFKSWKR